MSCSTLVTLGYKAWTPMGYFSYCQGVSVGNVIYISVVPGENTNHSDTPPSTENPDWTGPFTLEELNRGLQIKKADAK